MGQDRYDYQKLQEDLETLQRLFGIDCFSIGSSVQGRALYVAKMGSGEKQVFLNAAHHGLEWITAPILTRFLYDVLNYGLNEKRLLTYNVAALLRQVTFHVLPMVNPDGVQIALYGSRDPYLIGLNRSSTFSDRWQANARGVDLNHNYDAGFLESRRFAYELGIIGPGATRYAGAFPESEPEVKAVCDYVRKIPFSLAVAYHSQGEVIYYDYHGHVPPGGLAIAREMGLVSGYLLDKTEGVASYGGFKDWFIDRFDKPAYTIEVGHGKNPLGIYQFEEIYRKNLELLLLSAFIC